MCARPCRLCRKCDTEGPCRKARLARPATEASGTDVYKTARDNGFSINVVTSYDGCANCFGLVFLE